MGNCHQLTTGGLSLSLEMAILPIFRHNYRINRAEIYNCKTCLPASKGKSSKICFPETTILTCLEHKNVIVTNYCARMKNKWLQATELRLHTSAIPEPWTELQIHYVEYTRRLREENITFSQNLNAFEAAEIHCLGSVFSSLSALSFPDMAQKEKLKKWKPKVSLLYF